MQHFFKYLMIPKKKTLVNSFPPFTPFDFFQTHIILKISPWSFWGNSQQVCVVFSILVIAQGWLKVTGFAQPHYTGPEQ